MLLIDASGIFISMEQDYWVTVHSEEASHFNPRAEQKKLKGGLVKVWYGSGLPSQTRAQDEQGIRDNLSKDGISPVKITTK